MVRFVIRLALSLVALAFVSGCCGGYSVVQTRVEGEPDAQILHYSRVGEPANACGSNVKYVEDLFIRAPSLRTGETLVLGSGGVTATYTRGQEGAPESTGRVSGTVVVLDQTPDGLAATLDVTIALASGEVVRLDDEYTFHPAR